MERLLTPKQRANAALKIVRELKRRQRQTARDAQQQEKSNDDSSSRFLKEIDQILKSRDKNRIQKSGPQH